MDVTITYNEVAALIGNNIPSLELHPNFERIRVLRQHFELALRHIPCPQSTQFGWKGMVMSQAMYALHTSQPFHIPTSPGAVANYTHPVAVGQPPSLFPLDPNQTGIHQHEVQLPQALLPINEEHRTSLF
jgi:hypothetical protein